MNNEKQTTEIPVPYVIPFGYKLEIGKSNFRDRILEGCIYVDKTQYIYRLINNDSNCFLSRPRRFGKSLLISTLKEIFSGSKELFKDCWIYDKIEWKSYPIIHIDFLGLDYLNIGLDQALDYRLNDIAANFNVSLKKPSIKAKFSELIDILAQNGGKVVVLIDEYDKPIIDYLDNIPEARKNQDILKNFFSVLKYQNQYIRFLLITGVSKFTRVSIFSDLNHIADLTLDPNYSMMLGYTKEEIQRYFKPHLAEWEKQTGTGSDTLFEELKNHYDGYSWDAKNFVYNPFSILSFFRTYKFDNYWFITGSPAFLVKKLKNTPIFIDKYDYFEVNNSFFDKFDIESIDISVILFQTGYLTIKSIIGPKYVLSYPNREVRESLLQNLLEGLAYKSQNESIHITRNIKQALEEKKIGDFIGSLKILLSSIPYNIQIENRESYYHSVIYIALQLSLNEVQCETQSARGRSDIMVSTDGYIYVIEFKMASAEKALEQIEKQQYFMPCMNKNKEIILMGIAFDEVNRNIGDWKMKTIPIGTRLEDLELLKEEEPEVIILPIKDPVEEARKEAKRQMARQMLADNLPIELIVKYSGLTEEEIKAL